MSEKIISPIVRCSFPHLGRPHLAPGAEKPKFSVALMYDKNDPDHVAAFKALVKTAKKCAVDKFNKKAWEDARKWRWGWKDGDKEGRDEWKGHWIVNISSNQEYRPRVVSPAMQEYPQEQIDQEVYAGCWIRASYAPYAWGPNVGGMGVSLGLRNVQKIRDDEPFGSSSRPEDDFDVFEDTDDGFSSDFNEVPEEKAQPGPEADLDDDFDDDDEGLF